MPVRLGALEIGVSGQSILDDVMKVAAGAGGLGASVVTARWFLGWISGRVDKSQESVDRERQALEAARTAIDAAWKDYRLQLETELRNLRETMALMQKEIDDCHRDKIHTAEKLARMEAYIEGHEELRRLLDQP